MKKIILFLILFVSSINFAMAQKTVKGTVSDELEPLIGATIQIKGTGTGVATDFDGSYTISVPNNEAVLIFSYIGLETQEIIVGTQTTIDVVLKEFRLID